jgi:hypothetical protein
MSGERRELTQEFIFSKLRYLRDDFSEEIPKRIIHSTDPDNRYKVRAAWFTCVSAYLSLGMRKGFISDELRERAQEFIDYCASDQFHYQPRRSLADIERANMVINKVVGEDQPEEKAG